mgnify:CR=1 FL=1
MAEEQSASNPVQTSSAARQAGSRVSLASRLAGREGDWLLLGLSLGGVALVLLITRLGGFLSDDSYYYIYPAREFAAGRGFNPSYIFAPLFPFVLALINGLGIDALIAARWLNALLFGVNIFLVGRVIRRSGVPAGFALLGAALVLLADVIAEAHGWVMSEAISFTFMLLSLDFCLAYLASGARRAWWISAICASLTVLARYAAIPLIAALCLELLIFSPSKRLLIRLKEAALFGMVGLLPIALYWLRNQITTGHVVRYQRYFIVPLTGEQLTWFSYNWLSLFVPGRLLHGHEILALGLALAGGAALLALVWWFYRRRWETVRDQGFRASVMLLIFVFGLDLLMLYLARGLTELDVFNSRYLVPLLMIFLMLMVLLAGRLWQVAGRRMQIALVGFLAVFLAYYAFRTVDFARTMMRIGLGYANIGWHNSETIDYLHQHPEITHLVSTGEMGIYFWTGNKPKVISDFPNQQAMRDYICQNGASLLLMDQMPVGIYGMTHNEAIRGLALVKQFNDSEMYRCATEK